MRSGGLPLVSGLSQWISFYLSASNIGSIRGQWSLVFGVMVNMLRLDKNQIVFSGTSLNLEQFMHSFDIVNFLSSIIINIFGILLISRLARLGLMLSGILLNFASCGAEGLWEIIGSAVNLVELPYGWTSGPCSRAQIDL